MSERFEVVIRWTIADIKALKPKWSDDRCEEFLQFNEESFHDVSNPHGWEVWEQMADEEND